MDLTPSFPQFANLPIELRLQIFRTSAQPRSIHIIQHQPESYEQLIAKRGTYTILSPLIPTAFHICRESRAEMMRYYHFVIHYDHHGRGLAGFHFDYQIDSVEFSRLSSDCQSYYLSSMESAKLMESHSIRSRHLVLGTFHSDLEIRQYTGHEAVWILRYLLSCEWYAASVGIFQRSLAFGSNRSSRSILPRRK